MNMSTKTIKISIDDLIDKFKKYNDNEEDIALIRRAYDYAEKKHFGQKRISGDDYILHPLNVALILTEISADAPCMAAALLHDTIEDSDATKEEIEELLKGNGEEVNDPNFFAKMGSTMGIIKEVKTDNSDSSIADMVIQGVSMGSIETEKKLKAYEKDIEKEYKDLAERFLKFQQKSIDKLKKYL